MLRRPRMFLAALLLGAARAERNCFLTLVVDHVDHVLAADTSYEDVVTFVRAHLGDAEIMGEGCATEECVVEELVAQLAARRRHCLESDEAAKTRAIVGAAEALAAPWFPGLRPQPTAGEYAACRSADRTARQAKEADTWLTAEPSSVGSVTQSGVAK